MDKKKYELHIGCHRGTLTSRDAEIRHFDTLEEAKLSIVESVKGWAPFGYMLWFASIRDPEGSEVYREGGAPYTR